MVDEQIRSDFDRARQRAFFHDVFAAIRRQRNDLIPYHEVRDRVKPDAENYRGFQVVPVAQIVGSVDRFRDFDRAFLPRRRTTAGRWQSIDRAFYEDVRLPPIQLYKVGDVYFVKDGNHRVSVARERGVEFIDAEVIEGHIRVPLYASMRPQELLLQVEYGEFLRRTNLDRLRPDHDIRPTALGRYDEIWDHIQLHRDWLSQKQGQECSLDDAVTDWYDSTYCPIVNIIRDRRLLRHFPGRSEADLYLWTIDYREDLGRREGKPFSPAHSAVRYADRVDVERALTTRITRLPRTVTRRIQRKPPLEPISKGS